jgi:hypothetical protein
MFGWLILIISLSTNDMSLLDKAKKKIKEDESGKLSIFSRMILHGGNTADAGSTIYALKSGARESNPIYGNDPKGLKIGLIKAGTSIGTDFALSKLAKKHPKLANGLAKGLGVGLMAIAASNINQAKK